MMELYDEEIERLAVLFRNKLKEILDGIKT
jgi:hypothetical protein